MNVTAFYRCKRKNRQENGSDGEWRALRVKVCIGFVLAFFHIQIGIPALLLTFAMEYVLRGAASGLSAVSPALSNSQMGLQFLCYGDLWGVPCWAFIFFAVFLTAVILLHYTYIGKCFYAVGSDSKAARRAGLPVDKVKLVAFVLCAVLVNITTLLFLAWMGISKESIAADTSFDVLMALCLGGISLYGARGTVAGVVLGTLALILVESFLIVTNITVVNRYIVKGTILLLTIWIQQQEELRRAERII